MFYQKGLKFECQRCLYCCSGEPGYVYLSKEDLVRAAAETGLDENKFIDIYCRLIDFGNYYMVSLKEKSNYDCIFLTSTGCSIYNGRPTQCRTYPFWKNIMESERNWKEEGKCCPGIGKGARISKEEIEQRLKAGDNDIPYIILKKSF